MLVVVPGARQPASFEGPIDLGRPPGEAPSIVPVTLVASSIMRGERRSERPHVSVSQRITDRLAGSRVSDMTVELVARLPRCLDTACFGAHRADACGFARLEDHVRMAPPNEGTRAVRRLGS
jgi:hypothetical protein